MEGRSSLARCGLNIATATTVHPHFTGCLTLELANMGEVPLARPGMLICQLVFFQVAGDAPRPEHASHSGYRRPIMNPVRLDEVARREEGRDSKCGAVLRATHAPSVSGQSCWGPVVRSAVG